MAIWTVGGKTYRCAWVNPKDHANEGAPATQVVPDVVVDGIETGGFTIVFIPDDSVPRGAVLDNPPKGESHVIAIKAQTAVGNVLKSRPRIDFLRLVREFPYGQEPAAIGLNGGGDPRAHANQQDKAPAKRLLQPGEFPDKADKAVGRLTTLDDEPRLAAAIAGLTATDILTRATELAGPPPAPLDPLTGTVNEADSPNPGGVMTLDSVKRHEQEQQSEAVNGDGNPSRESADDSTSRTDAAPPIADPVPAAPTPAAPDQSAAPDYQSAAPDYAAAAPETPTDP